MNTVPSTTSSDVSSNNSFLSIDISIIAANGAGGLLLIIVIIILIVYCFRRKNKKIKKKIKLKDEKLAITISNHIFNKKEKKKSSIKIIIHGVFGKKLLNILLI